MNQRYVLFILVVLLSFVAFGCTMNQNQSPQLVVQLVDENTGFTTSDVNLTCIVESNVPVDNLSILLTNRLGMTSSQSITDVNTLNVLSFENITDGSYTSECIACASGLCNSSSTGSVLVSIDPLIGARQTFDLPPSFVLGTPIDETYFLSDKPLAVTFSCLGTDDVGLSAISLITNVSGVLSEAFIQNPTTNTFLLSKTLVLSPGIYLWTCRATDTRAQTTVAPIRSFVIGPATEVVLPKVDGFDGSTTDFSKLSKLTNVDDVVLEKTDFGKIQFTENISSLVGVDLSKGIVIEQNSITVNSTLYPQLNVPAKLSFYNIVYDAELEDLLINKDDQQYAGFNDLRYDDGVLEFSVQNFSTYTVVITPKGGYNVVEVDNSEPEEVEPEEDSVDQDFESVDFEQGEESPDVEFVEGGEPQDEEVVDYTSVDDTSEDFDDANVSFRQVDSKEDEDAKQEQTSIEDSEDDFDDEPITETNPWLMLGLSVVLFLIIFAIIRYNKHKSQKTILHKPDTSKYNFK